MNQNKALIDWLSLAVSFRMGSELESKTEAFISSSLHCEQTEQPRR